MCRRGPMGGVVFTLGHPWWMLRCAHLEAPVSSGKLRRVTSSSCQNGEARGHVLVYVLGRALMQGASPR